jgi:hypothetical protein
VVTHLSVVNKEIEFYQWPIIVGYVTAFGAIVCGEVILSEISTLKAVVDAFLLISCFNVGLATFTVLHRAFFHRLNGVPGPFMARLTSFYTVHSAAKDYQFHRQLEEWHRQYGDVVRIGK